MKKVLFIDRDGTIIHEPAGTEQIDSLELLEFVPGAIIALAEIAAKTDFKLVLVTNQDGLGTSSFPEKKFLPPHRKMLDTLKGEGVQFYDTHIDRTTPAQKAPTRKPGTAMLTKYFSKEYDLKNSYVIGDRITDLELAKNLVCKAILINCKKTVPKELRPFLALNTKSWKAIRDELLAPGRIITRTRKTNETDVRITINLDGKGKTSIETGLPFFDHMLEQLGKHSGIDLTVKTKGDIRVDEHHTIEDTAIALGEAFADALGDKKGIERYGFCLPMDDCLAQVALDFGGRSWLVWNADFKRESIGSVPTEMFFHFFKSFCDGARCNLNVKAEGTNEHHKIEAVFKAFARAIKMAIRREPGNTTLPSTKGRL